jgi:hypothetical protein
MEMTIIWNESPAALAESEGEISDEIWGSCFLMKLVRCVSAIMSGGGKRICASAIYGRGTAWGQRI